MYNLGDIFKSDLFVEIVGVIAGILTSVSMLPQVVKVIKEKKAEDISYAMVIILIAGIGCWVFYGILRNDLPIIFTNSFSFLVNIILLVLASKYKRK